MRMVKITNIVLKDARKQLRNTTTRRIRRNQKLQEQINSTTSERNTIE